MSRREEFNDEQPIIIPKEEENIPGLDIRDCYRINKVYGEANLRTEHSIRGSIMELEAAIATKEAALAQRKAAEAALAQSKATLTYLEKESKDRDEHYSKLGDRVARLQDILFGSEAIIIPKEEEITTMIKEENIASLRGPCAACIVLKKPCPKGCIFAPYFPAGEKNVEDFRDIDELFGAVNVKLMLKGCDIRHREELMKCTVFRAKVKLSRVNDRVRKEFPKILEQRVHELTIWIQNKKLMPAKSADN